MSLKNICKNLGKVCKLGEILSKEKYQNELTEYLKFNIHEISASLAGDFRIKQSGLARLDSGQQEQQQERERAGGRQKRGVPGRPHYYVFDVRRGNIVRQPVCH